MRRSSIKIAMTWHWLALCCGLLPSLAHAQGSAVLPLPERYHDVTFQRDTGAVVIREDDRLLHIAADGKVEQLPPFAVVESQVKLLTLADGLWVRDGTRFGFFRPGPHGWTSGAWQVAQPLSARELRHTHVFYAYEDSPLLTGQGQGHNLRLRATEHGIEAIALTRDELGNESDATPPAAELRYDEREKRCLVQRTTPAGVAATRALPESAFGSPVPCTLEVKTSTGRLWLEADDFLLAEQGDGWWMLRRDFEPPPPVSADSPMYVSNDAFDKLAPWLGALALVVALIVGTRATHESSQRAAFRRALSCTLGTVPSLLFVDATRHITGAHDYGILLYVPAALLFSPLPAIATLLAGRIGEDGARHRGRGTWGAFAATIVSALLMLPLSSLIGDDSEPKRQLLATLLSIATVGLATSLAYNYSAGLPGRLLSGHDHPA